MTIIKIDGIPSVLGVLKTIDKFNNQIPFASSLAINATSIAVQTHVVKKLLPRKFKLRKPWSKPKTRFGINIKFSNKKNLTSSIGSRAPWLKDHEEGGTRRGRAQPNTSNKLLTMPVRDIRQDKRRLVPKKFQPNKIFANTKKPGFWITSDGEMFLMQRTGKAKRDIRILFTTARTAKIRGDLKYEETGRKIVNKQYQFQFKRALAKAMRTARGKIR